MTTRRITLTAILSALALIIYVLENFIILIPALPFFKIGFSNIVIMFTLIWFGMPYAVTVAFIRNILGSIFAGNLSMLIYSMPAAGAALIIMWVLLKVSFKFSAAGISAAAAAVHNIIQVFIFCAVTNSAAPLIYLPYLVVCGAAAGIITGIAVYYSVRYMPELVIME